MPLWTMRLLGVPRPGLDARALWRGLDGLTALALVASPELQRACLEARRAARVARRRRRAATDAGVYADARRFAWPALGQGLQRLAELTLLRPPGRDLGAV